MATVPGEGMSSAKDRDLIAVCRAEGRCLVALDLDFGNPLVFPPWDFSRIAVLRLPPKPADDDLWACCRMLVEGLAKRDVTGKVWIAQRDRIREYQPDRGKD